MAEMYFAVDALPLNQKAAVKDAVIPSKLLEYLAVGPAEDPRALVDAVHALRSALTFCQRLGNNGRAYAEANFAKSNVLKRYDEFLARFDRPPAELMLAVHPPGDRWPDGFLAFHTSR